MDGGDRGRGGFPRGGGVQPFQNNYFRGRGTRGGGRNSGRTAPPLWQNARRCYRQVWKNIKLAPTKSSWITPSTTFVGFEIDQCGVKPELAKGKAMKKLGPP